MTFAAQQFHRPIMLMRAVAALATGCAMSFSAVADEVRVLTAVALRPVVEAMAPVYEKQAGHKLRIVSDGADALAERVRRGEPFELAVLPPAMLETLSHEGLVSGGSITALARAPSGAYAGAVAADAANSGPALSLLILLASEDGLKMVKQKGLDGP